PADQGGSLTGAEFFAEGTADVVGRQRMVRHSRTILLGPDAACSAPAPAPAVQGPRCRKKYVTSGHQTPRSGIRTEGMVIVFHRGAVGSDHSPPGWGAWDKRGHGRSARSGTVSRP